MRSFDSNIDEYDYAMQHMKCGKRYSEYRPFITTQSFHSSASRRRVYVPRFNRDFHLMLEIFSFTIPLLIKFVTTF